MKLRSDNALAQLNDEQRAQLYDWLVTLGYTETIRKASLPPPDGFGIVTYRSSLHRFYVRYTLEARASHCEMADEVRASGNTTPALRSGTEDILQHAAFQLATSPHGVEEFSQLSRWVLKQKAHEQKQAYVEIARQHLALSQQRLALDREKFEFNAARQAILHHTSIETIVTDQTKDNEDKIRAVRMQLFGCAPE